MEIDFRGINDAALGQFRSLLESWLPDGTILGHEYLAINPNRRDDHRLGSFSININTGKWADFATDVKGGDVISLKAYLDKIGQGEAARRIAHEVGLDVDRKDGGDRAVAHKPTRTKSSKPPAENQERALSKWKASQPIANTAGEIYLRQHRSIDLPLPGTLRCHPRQLHGPSGKHFPCLIAAIQAPSDEIVAIHRIYLADGGSGKAFDDDSKWSLGPMGVGAVRLAPAQMELGLAEGIESALSAMQIFGVPCWAVLGVRYAQIWLPHHVRRVTLFGDRGRHGEDAVLRARSLIASQGREVRIALPDAGKDWNDALCEASALGFHSMKPARSEG